MNGTRKWVGIAPVVTLCLILGSLTSLGAQTPAAGQDSGATKAPAYTLVEYNAEQACAAEKVPATQVKCLDDFVAKYPNSALLVYVYPLFVNAYNQLKNPQKVIEYADKLVAMGDKAEAVVRYQMLYARALAYATLPQTDQTAGAAKAREAASLGLKTLDEVKKPDNVNVSDEDFKKQKQQPTILFNYTAANAAMTAKDYPSAVQSFKAVLALDPDDLSTNYNLGRAYLAMTPPQPMAAFWYFAKSVTSKKATQAQADKVKKYLKGLIANHQGGNVCDSLTDGELNELLQLAGSSADRPSTYSLPSAAEFDAATTPNMDVKVVGQPEAARVEKNSAVHFTGTLVAYDPAPFFLHWDKAKVKEEDIPKDKGPKKAPVRRPTRKPSGRSN